MVVKVKIAVETSPTYGENRARSPFLATSGVFQQVFDQAIRIMFKRLNRRSQRRSYNWTGFRELLENFRLEQPRIVR
jgi:hypothetical protein